MSLHDEDRNNTGDEHGTEYDGVDALMAAILDEPLPAAARQDPAFTAARDAAAADVAVLREQLGLIGDTLAREAEPGPVPVRPLPAVARPPRRARRPLRVAFGALAAAAAASVVLGMGWLVTQAGQGDGMSSSAEADRKAVGADEAPGADEASGAKGSAGTGFGTPHYLACARLVAEGTVSAVEPVPGTGQERVTLEVTRRYKPAPGTGPDENASAGEQDEAGEVTFLTEPTEPTGPTDRPPLHTGDRVMVGLPREGSVPDAVIVGEEDIAPERARITAALPASRTLTCE
ncbi:hypothetical protein OIE73_13275 [Streptomyces hirsutus]|uniref:Uncharacterized protein n=1 Tax=Streptomyces hirsutus TaxID=35620 RepID=A0ABZ1GKF3_9ACTN|nr:hypothetical protein [Streptomyces hirsutus]WSD06652.1 hypothetical protein OIE73_13275 [Streptomyces hirsutus]